MKFKFETVRQNYEDLAAGRVIMTYPGATSFPVRLASEIFQRCAAIVPKRDLRVYDPCCGSGYLLTVLGFMHSSHIRALYASDIDPMAVTFARKNLALLTAEGLRHRQQALEAMLHHYGKASHSDALNSLRHLRQQQPAELGSAVWVADALTATVTAGCIDVLITDVPYGQISAWKSRSGDEPIQQLLETHAAALAQPAVVAIISDKSQKVYHPRYCRVDHFTHGKRRITLLQPV